MYRIFLILVVLIGILPVNAQQSSNIGTVSTFHSISIYWGVPNNGAASVQYRKANTDTWYDGYPLFYDDGEYRGSIVNLPSDTVFDIRLTNNATSENIRTATWSNTFPISRIVYLPERSGSYTITEGGSESGYVLYTHAQDKTATIDGERSANTNLTINASYVIVRELTLKDARRDSIVVNSTANHVVIEGNDISGWGLRSGDSAIATLNRTMVGLIIRRNTIYNPAVDADWNSGPHVIYARNGDIGGQVVVAYNHIYSDNGNHVSDIMGGWRNFEITGWPNRDSDIYGNDLSGCNDNAIESEGGNLNVRIWGNRITGCYSHISNRDAVLGPLYIWRNVIGSAVAGPYDSRAFKTGLEETNGTDFVLITNNTILQPNGVEKGLEGPMRHTVVLNNILQTAGGRSIDTFSGHSTNTYDYNLVNHSISGGKVGSHNIVGSPLYGSNYALLPNSPGFDAGVVIPNFTTGYTNGSAPDMGAQEYGMPPMEFGVDAYLNYPEPYGEDFGDVVVEPTETPVPTITNTPTATTTPFVPTGTPESDQCYTITICGDVEIDIQEK